MGVEKSHLLDCRYMLIVVKDCSSNKVQRPPCEQCQNIEFLENRILLKLINCYLHGEHDRYPKDSGFVWSIRNFYWKMTVDLALYEFLSHVCVLILFSRVKYTIIMFFCNQVVASAELIGEFVEPAVYLKLCLPHLKSASTTSTQQTASVLRILAAMIKGTPDVRMKPHLKVKGELYCFVVFF